MWAFSGKEQVVRFYQLLLEQLFAHSIMQLPDELQDKYL